MAQITNRRWQDLYKTHKLVAWYKTTTMPDYNIVCWMRDGDYVIHKWVGGNASVQLTFTSSGEANEDIKYEFTHCKDPLVKRSRQSVIHTLSFFDWFNESEALGIY